MANTTAYRHTQLTMNSNHLFVCFYLFRKLYHKTFNSIMADMRHTESMLCAEFARASMDPISISWLIVSDAFSIELKRQRRKWSIKNKWTDQWRYWFFFFFPSFPSFWFVDQTTKLFLEANELVHSEDIFFLSHFVLLSLAFPIGFYDPGNPTMAVTMLKPFRQFLKRFPSFKYK